MGKVVKFPKRSKWQRPPDDPGPRRARLIWPAFWTAIVVIVVGALFLHQQFAIGPPTVSADSAIVGRASVVDGDTLDIHGDRIRLWGIDAPESGQRCRKDGRPWRCGTESASELDAFLVSQTVSCDEQDRDRYGRIVAVCEVAGRDLGSWLVENGWALDYERYSDGAYASEQDQAESRERGIWQGEFKAPWEWRRR